MSHALSAKPYVAVVEDDESLCRSLARLLAASGFHPVTYHSAEAFLADSNRPVFQCLVLDIQLGGISGLELNERLEASGSSIPVILMTARADAEMLHRGLKVRCASVLRKSEPGAKLLAAINETIQGKKADEEP